LIDEALEVFRKIYDKEGEELVVSKHIPKDGTYILVNIKSGKIIETLNISYDKKTKKIDGELNQYYNYFRAFDYYSNLVDMNKPMDPKKTIHSNQIYSFFIKKDSIRENKLTKSIIEGYKKNLLNPEEKYNSKEAKELYKNIAEKLPKIEKDIIEDIFLWIEENVNENLLENDNKKDYLKIFFVEDDLEKSLELFRNEHKRYLIPNIFNSNDYNKRIGETIYGLSNNNMGLNAKKIFLENKTRRISTPYLVNTDEILLQYAFYNYLLPEVKQGNYFIYFTENEIIPRTYKEGCPSGAKYLLNASYSKDVDIKNFNIISKNSSEEISINFKEILHQKKKDTDEIEYGNLNKEKMMKAIGNGYFFKASQQLDSGFCLEKYFYGKSELMEEIMNVKEVFLFVKNIDVLKEKIKKIVISYSHIFETKNKKINRTVSNISLYQPKEIRIDILLAGFTADIIFFKKREEK